MKISYYDREHVKSLIEEGYSEQDIAEVTGHSLDWVRNAKPKQVI